MVGAAGVGAVEGTDAYGAAGIKSAGGATTISLNGIVILTVGGGLGGVSATNTLNVVLSSGGLGGSPNGLSGQTGPSGTNDHSSEFGGGGAPGPLEGCLGGAGGKYYQPYTFGSAGVGPGSGGGGGGSADRSGSDADGTGGAGQPGYVEFTYPTQGSTGGTASQNNNGYMVNAIASPGGGSAGTGGGFTGGSGYGGSNASGLF